MAADVASNAKFLQWHDLYEREKPFHIFVEVPPHAKDQRRTNLIYEDREIIFHDVRGREPAYNLNEHGFAFHKQKILFEDFENAPAVQSEYLPEMERILKEEVDGVDKVFIFDWRLRNSAQMVKGTVLDLERPTDWLRPAIHAHTDQSIAAVVNRVMMHFPAEAPELLRGRVRIINLWKPLKHPVYDWPLAVCDGSTVKEGDLIGTDHIRRRYCGETMNMLYRPEQKWYYLSEQGPDDVLLLKIFDSSPSVAARWCPHVSFNNTNQPPDAPIRESIE